MDNTESERREKWSNEELTEEVGSNSTTDGSYGLTKKWGGKGKKNLEGYK